jgi:hypothetical protein
LQESSISHFPNILLLQISKKDIDTNDNTVKYMDITEKNKIEFYLDDNKITKLDKIVKELNKLNAIDSQTIEEFLKLTIFIVLYEYDKNKQSLNEFYRQNREIYKEKG